MRQTFLKKRFAFMRLLGYLFVNPTSAPSTVASIRDDLSRLGVARGMTLLVHSSLSSIGFVCGGAVAVVEALLSSVGPEGTLVMPAHSGDLSEPSRWKHPPVPEDWWPIIRSETPAFDPMTTPTRNMGAIAEAFRRWPGTLRSAHPAGSFAARGSFAQRITDAHTLEDTFGEQSPLARLYDLDAFVLLLGVGFNRNTSFHLAEHRSGCRQRIVGGSPILENGVRVWKEYTDLAYDADPFPDIGGAFAAAGYVHTDTIGAAVAQFFSQRACVDFAVQQLTIGNTPGALP
jgi:aminoglycoside 3-N-acetyltransferase